MVYESPSAAYEHRTEEQDDLELSEGENNDNAEMIREFSLHLQASPRRAELVLA